MKTVKEKFEEHKEHLLKQAYLIEEIEIIKESTFENFQFCLTNDGDAATMALAIESLVQEDSHGEDFAMEKIKYYFETRLSRV